MTQNHNSNRTSPIESRLKAQRGLTLIEVLVVLVIIGLIAGLVAPRVIKYVGGARTDTARIQIEQLSSALDLYRLEIGRYPTEEEGLEALVEQPPSVESWNGPYIRNAKAIIDPWGNPYVYRFPSEQNDFGLYSLGADGQEGGEGENQDINVDNP